jgi:predicted aldo/keto reductase-like oxidoreductase
MGLAYHDDAYFLQEIYGVYPDWALIQLELSALDYRHHPGVGGFRIIGDHGTAIVATDCTKAGRLLKNIPAEVLGILNDAGTARVPAEWYLSWALGNQEVSSVLLDLDTEARAAEYMAFAGSFTAGDAGVTESLQAARIRDAYNARRRVQCAACRCCMPCPLGIDEPRIIELYNDYLMFGDAAIPGLLYLLEGHARLDCIRCDRCRTSCPKHFPVPDILADMKSLSKS